MALGPIGCDTFVAFPPVAPPDTVIFGKNSDRPAGEGQSIRRYPAQDFLSSHDTECKCTYIGINQASRTHATLLSQIDWMFGAEMGANEHGVVVGNEAVWTRVPYEKPRSGLVGMDLVRLGLERGKTASEAMKVITELLERHGQCGPCAQDDESFDYHNSFLLADCKEAWVLESAGRHWVAERITSGARNISNCLTIRNNYDLCSKGMLEYAKTLGLWNGKGETLDFAECFSDGPVEQDPQSRQLQGTALMNLYPKGMLDAQAMMEILKDHKSGICMHGGFETTSSMVSELKSSGQTRHWLTGKPHPCQSSFEIQEVKDS